MASEGGYFFLGPKRPSSKLLMGGLLVAGALVTGGAGAGLDAVQQDGASSGTQRGDGIGGVGEGQAEVGIVSRVVAVHDPAWSPGPG